MSYTSSGCGAIVNKYSTNGGTSFTTISSGAGTTITASNGSHMTFEADSTGLCGASGTTTITVKDNTTNGTVGTWTMNFT